VTAHIIRVPPRRSAAIFVTEVPGDGWLVLAREHGWLHGDQRAAVAEAKWLAENLELPIRKPQ
jgi:hypothetical protein